MADEPAGAANEAGVAGFLFDLDGTLVDSVYQHVLSWHDALCAEGIAVLLHCMLVGHLVPRCVT